MSERSVENTPPAIAVSFWSKLLPVWFALVAFGLAVNSVVSYKSVRRLVSNESAVSKARDTIGALEDVLSTLKDAETGQRGFVITDEQSYLTPYQSALVRIHRDLTRLEDLLSLDPRQAPRLEVVKRETDTKLRELKKSLELRRTDGFEAAQAYIKLDAGKNAMDKLRAVIAEMEQLERDELGNLSNLSSNSSKSALGTLVGGAVVNLLLLGGVFWVSNQYARQRELSAAEGVRSTELLGLNKHLNEEVLDRQRAEEAQRLLATRLQVSNRELQDFASVASHDLQEPLRKVQAFGDRLRARYSAVLDVDGLDYLARMQAAAARMQTLINDLLTFSRITTKALPFAPTDLSQVVREVLSDLETRIESSGGTVEVGALPVIDADALQMRQLMQNLIANALKFTRPGVAPHVVVQPQPHANGSSASGSVTVLIRDNGIGFEEKYLDRIFTVFQRLHGRGTYEGTGIGLAVCRKIAERHHGSITARSMPGEGATFILTLPTHQPEQLTSISPLP